MDTTWILVADGSRARLFSASKIPTPWILLDEFEHSESRAKTIELDPTERGRQKSSFGVGNRAAGSGAASSRAAMEPKTAPRRVEQIHFAQQLKDRLSDGLRHGAYSQLVLVAPPRFLGQLKAMLDPAVSKCVVRTVDKDYTKSNVAELVERLGEFVYGEEVAGHQGR